MSKELLFSVKIEDCEVQTFRSGSKGGQHANKVETGVRIIHHASGAITESREERSQRANKVIAFQRLAEHSKFKTWHKIETGKRLGQSTPEQLVEQAMQPSNIKTEVKDSDGRWVEATEPLQGDI